MKPISNSPTFTTCGAHASLIFGLLALLPAASNAAVIASYVDGTDADSAALAELTSSVGVTASALSAVGFTGGTSITRTEFGAAVSTPAGPTAGSSAASEWLFARSRNSTGTSNTTPGTSTDYFGFTVAAANVGETLDLNTLKFDFVAVGDVTGLARLFVNVDSGGFNAIGSEFSATATSGFGTVTQASVDLSSITGATSVEFRIGLGDNRDTDGAATYLQGIQLDANVIPEPSAALLGGLGLLALLRHAVSLCSACSVSPTRNV